MANRNQKKNRESVVHKILNDPKSIIVALAVLVVAVLFYNRYLIGQIKLYSFSAYTKDFSFMSGTIYASYDLNYFSGAKILYSGEDETIYDFEMGYYIKEGSSYKDVAIAEVLDSAKDKGALLSELLDKTDFSFTEVKRDAVYLSKDNLKSLENLVFRINGKDKDGEKIEIEVPLEVVKVSK